MWQDVPVQLVDLPPISPEFFEPWVPGVIRSADAALWWSTWAAMMWRKRPWPCSIGCAESHTELVGELPYDVDDETIRHSRR